ncbi:cytochrome d ubiquinol oxidase subunit II [Novispirillum itersonii]|uniref:cytochrome d ubiquinol oxidase subunit II n=1 Tax=Novispirillum itersonii TaxID=189 RepID=UPI00036102F9|nr:cytochrome d ubiquinol oxidase subunit II [Novispirillum itersonii]
MMDSLLNAHTLPLIFTALMAVAVLAYVILDGYDLGIGILLGLAPETEKDVMIAAIGPFWDANETWLVLAVGLLLVAFPMAQGAILGTLYLPVLVLLIGLILRGVAFDFRTKARAGHKQRWNRLFAVGSIAATLAQGYMLGRFITGLDGSLRSELFSALTAVCLLAAYALLGAGWLILKADGALQQRALRWARPALILSALGLGAVSVVTPLVNPMVAARWFSLPEFLLLAPVPLMAAGLCIGLFLLLSRLPRQDDRWCWLPFALTTGIIGLGFLGIAYSFFPWIVPGKMTVWQAASSPEALIAILVVAAPILPVIILYSLFSYRVFWGKTGALRYD